MRRNEILDLLLLEADGGLSPARKRRKSRRELE
jgi:hypothetical protein